MHKGEYLKGNEVLLALDLSDLLYFHFYAGYGHGV